MFKKNIRFSVRNHLKYNANCTITQKTRQTKKKRKTKKKQRAAMKTKKVTVVTQKAVEQKITAVRKQSFKIKFRNFSESFKFEEFTSNFSSTSMISCFESIIKSNDIFAASSISISACISISKKFDESVATKTVAVAQKAMKQKIVDVIEAVKSEICVKNIKFLILQCS